MPDILYRRAKSVMARRGITLRSLVIDALERVLDEKPGKPFVLRDASVGYHAGRTERVTSDKINRAMDDVREPGFRA